MDGPAGAINNSAREFPPGRSSLAEVGQQISVRPIDPLSLDRNRAAHRHDRLAVSLLRGRGIGGRGSRLDRRTASRLAAASGLRTAAGLAASAAVGLAAAGAALPALLRVVDGAEEVTDRRRTLLRTAATGSRTAARLAAASTGVAGRLAAAVTGVASGFRTAIASPTTGLAATSTGIAAGLTARGTALVSEHLVQKLETKRLATNGDAKNQRTEKHHTLHRATSPLLADHAVCCCHLHGSSPRGCDPRTFRDRPVEPFRDSKIRRLLSPPGCPTGTVMPRGTEWLSATP